MKPREPSSKTHFILLCVLGCTCQFTRVCWSEYEIFEHRDQAHSCIILQKITFDQQKPPLLMPCSCIVLNTLYVLKYFLGKKKI